MATASPVLRPSDVNACSSEVTLRWNGIFQGGQERWHTGTLGRSAMKCDLRNVAKGRDERLSREGQPCFRTLGIPFGLFVCLFVLNPSKKKVKKQNKCPRFVRALLDASCAAGM